MRYILFWTFLMGSLLNPSSVYCDERFPIPRAKVETKERTMYESEIILSSGLVRRTYRVPQTFLSGGASPAAADPFAAEPENAPTRLTAKQVLSNAGIDFTSPGSSARYHHVTSTLIVTLPKPMIDLVDAYITPLGPDNLIQICTKLEIFELPAVSALEIIAICGNKSNHTIERKTLLKKTKIAFFTTLVSQSGTRSSLVDSENFNCNSGFHFKYDPVLGADYYTIDINLSFTYNTAPKATEACHQKHLSSQITVNDGKYYLIGSWRPTGKLKYTEKDLMHLVFLRSTIQKIPFP